MTTSQLTILRTAATVVITGLVAIQPLYPSFMWIPAIVAVAATVGIHVIPAVSSTPITTTEGAKTMADELTGAQMMGIAPVTAQKTEEVKPASNTPEVPVTTPVETAPKSEAPSVSVPADATPADVAAVAPDTASEPVSTDATPPVVADTTTAQKTDTPAVEASQPQLTDAELATLRKILDKLG